MQQFSNNASTTLAALLGDSATLLTVESSAGFAVITAPDYELVTLASGATVEILKVTARSGTTWTVERAQEGTTAMEWPSGSLIEARLTAGTMDAVMDDMDGIFDDLSGAMQAASYPDLSGLDQGGDARGTDAVNLQSGRLFADDVAAGSKSIAIGYTAQAASNDCVSIGPYSKAIGTHSIALGGSAWALGNASISIGNSSYAETSISSFGYFSIPVDDWNDQLEFYSAGTQSVFATPPVDLGVPPAWQASTAYAHGQIVQSTTGGTVQYRVYAEYDEGTLLHDTPTSDTTEPTWPGAGGDVEVNPTDGASWIGIDLDAGYETLTFPDWLEFFPTGIAFVCQEYSATTGTPTVSIGTPSDPTLILNAATVGITAVGQTYQFTLPNPCPCIPEGESILVTLDGAASAGVMAGRFVFTGVFMATRSRA